MVNETRPDGPIEPGLGLRAGLRAGRPLGDVVADVTHATGLDRLPSAYTLLTGKECGCDQRRQALNRLVPDTPL